MIGDDTRQDQQSLRDELDTPPSVHASIFARVAETRLDVYFTGMSRREYTQELANLLRDDPTLAPLFRQRREIREALAAAAAIRAARG